MLNSHHCGSDSESFSIEKELTDENQGEIMLL